MGPVQIRAATVVAILSTAIAASRPAPADGEFSTGFVDNGVYASSSPEVRSDWLDRTVGLRAGVVRLDISWSAIATAQPSDPTDPSDPAYDFTAFDAAIQDANTRGLRVLLTISRAPSYAEGPGGPEHGAPPGTWKPDPVAFGDFGQAVAARYSGSFQGLPRVRYFEAWNEPNLSDWMGPQWHGGKPASPSRYRRMLNEFYAGVKSVHADNVVVSGGLGPYGDPAGGPRMRPLRFLRQLFCLDGKMEATKKCLERPRFDVLAHHPINTSGPPRQSAFDPDDASTADLKFVGRTLLAAEREGAIAGNQRRHPIWATEMWWESNPPDPVTGVNLRQQAHRIEEAMYILWKQGAKVVINLPLRDPPFNPGDPYATLSSGVYFADGSPKPSAQAVRFPLVTRRTSEHAVHYWGKAPLGGNLRISRRNGGSWRTVETQRVRAGAVFTGKLSLQGAADFRAEVGGERSLRWRQAG